MRVRCARPLPGRMRPRRCGRIPAVTLHELDRAINATTAMLPIIVVTIPFVVAVLVVVAGSRPNLREAVTLTGAVSAFGVMLAMVPPLRAGQPAEVFLPELIPGVAFGLRADGLGMAFALIASGLWILASLYAVGYLRGEGAAHQTRFFASFAVCLGAAFGVALAADFFTFLVFYEVLTVATYPLVVHKQNDAAMAAGRRYLVYLLPGGVALLLAVAIIYAATGTLTFTPGGFVGDGLSGGALVAVFALTAVGFGTKSGVMPLHAWLPAAMVAPTPVSALLHAVAVVKAGVFGFARAIGFVFGPFVLAEVGATAALAALAAVTIVVASTTAVFQDGLKRRLAFSTIAQLSYIVLGLSILAAEAWTGALLQIVNHAVLKITLFFAAGALYVHAHLDRVSQLDGIGWRMPWTMSAFAVASVGLAGLPPMGGFVAKFYLVDGAFAADDVLYALVLLGSGLLSAGYLFPIVYRAFFRPPPEPVVRDEASPLMVVPLVVTATVGLLLGFGDLLGFGELAAGVAAAVFGGGM